LALDGGEMSASQSGHPPSAGSPQHPPTRMLGGPRNWSGHFGEENNILFQPEIEAQILSCSTHSLTIPTTLPQLILINQCHIIKTV